MLNGSQKPLPVTKSLPGRNYDYDTLAAVVLVKTYVSWLTVAIKSTSFRNDLTKVCNSQKSTIWLVCAMFQLLDNL